MLPGILHCEADNEVVESQYHLTSISIDRNAHKFTFTSNTHHRQNVLPTSAHIQADKTLFQKYVYHIRRPAIQTSEGSPHRFPSVSVSSWGIFL